MFFFYIYLESTSLSFNFWKNEVCTGLSTAKIPNNFCPFFFLWIAFGCCWKTQNRGSFFLHERCVYVFMSFLLTSWMMGSSLLSVNNMAQATNLRHFAIYVEQCVGWRRSKIWCSKRENDEKQTDLCARECERKKGNWSSNGAWLLCTSALHKASQVKPHAYAFLKMQSLN